MNREVLFDGKLIQVVPKDGMEIVEDGKTLAGLLVLLRG